MNSYYVMLDVGGTSIKAGILTNDGQLYENKMYSWASKAKENKEEIFENFARVIQELAEKIPGSDSWIEGIGMAFPGPFDYEQGISLMKGLDKYDAVYGCSIGYEVMKYLESVRGIRKDCPFLFLHDVEAFAIGESYFGQAAGYDRVLNLCIGTGAGSAFVDHKRIMKHDATGIPENGWIYKMPFREGVIDDYLSVRGLGNLSQQVFQRFMEGAALFELAEEGDTKALRVFEMFGEILWEAITPFLDSYEPNALVFGGQISKSFSYFRTKIEQECANRNIVVFLTPDTSKRALEGLYAKFQQKGI